MDKERIGIIGIGGMGSSHARNIISDNVPDGRLTAVCDLNPDRLKWAGEALGGDVKCYSKADELINSGEVDAVVIATPHYDHPPLAVQAFEKGLHVLTEKPAGVYTRQVREMNEAADRSNRVFVIMFNQRTNPVYQKLKDLLNGGELGNLKRTNWIITSWYRSQSYYDSGDWRASWSGEGGGVLLNQNPHNLDLWQWTCGMPKRVRAFCYFGKYHDIEVEDDVTAFVEYEDGVTGVYVTSTGDAPGSNRFEVTGDRGKIVIENGQLYFSRLRIPEREFNRTYRGGFGSPECWNVDVPVKGKATRHVGIINNWIEAILDDDTELLAPGHEGIKSLEISNAMLLSTWTDSWVDIPVDEDLFYEHLEKRIKQSAYRKKGTGRTLDVEDSF